MFNVDIFELYKPNFCALLLSFKYSLTEYKTMKLSCVARVLISQLTSVRIIELPARLTGSWVSLKMYSLLL